MPRMTYSHQETGFSIVEMMVAMLFTMLLMLGMASVFKSSLSSFVTAGERLSSGRRNRMALEMLNDDLNMAGQYLTQMDRYPSWVLPNNPGFWIEPGSSSTVPDALHLAFDDALPFDATLSIANATTTSNASSVYSRSALSSLPANLQIQTQADQVPQVKSGMYLVFKDAFDVKQIASVVSSSGSTLTVTLQDAPYNQAGAPTGSTGLYFSVPHLNGAPILIVKPAQQVRYQIQNLNLDTSDAAKTIPCLVREQTDYGKNFVNTEPTYSISIIAENVTNFKVQLSVDGGANWISGTTWSAMLASLDSALATSGREGFQAVSGNPHWYRDIPTLVKMDLTTQTAMARSEYSSTSGTAAKKTLTQTLMVSPKYFGLSYYQ